MLALSCSRGVARPLLDRNIGHRSSAWVRCALLGARGFHQQAHPSRPRCNLQHTSIRHGLQISAAASDYWPADSTQGWGGGPAEPPNKRPNPPAGGNGWGGKGQDDWLTVFNAFTMVVYLAFMYYGFMMYLIDLRLKPLEQQLDDQTKFIKYEVVLPLDRLSSKLDRLSSRTEDSQSRLHRLDDKFAWLAIRS